MNVTIATLGIDRMTVRDRLDLIEQIWDSLPQSICAEEIPDWHLAELVHRRAELANEPGKGRPWREVLDSLKGGT